MLVSDVDHVPMSSGIEPVSWLLEMPLHVEKKRPSAKAAKKSLASQSLQRRHVADVLWNRSCQLVDRKVSFRSKQGESTAKNQSPVGSQGRQQRQIADVAGNRAAQVVDLQLPVEIDV
jgi:hypothetical protein